MKVPGERTYSSNISTTVSFGILPNREHVTNIHGSNITKNVIHLEAVMYIHVRRLAMPK
jgi:hypothetical protein